MTTDKRKAQLSKAQAKHRAKKRAAGWKWMQVPSEIMGKIKELIAELERR